MIWGWKISSFFLYFLEILEITEILEILEIQAQIYLNVNRMTQSVIGAIPPGGFGGAGAPQSVDPLLSWLNWTEPNRSDSESCFKSAENRAASSPWVGGYR